MAGSIVGSRVHPRSGRSFLASLTCCRASSRDERTPASKNRCEISLEPLQQLTDDFLSPKISREDIKKDTKGPWCVSKPMRIKFWGVRGSTPTPQPENMRYGGNTSCVEVRHGDRIYIFDCGTGFRV